MSIDLTFVPTYFQPILERIEEVLDADVDIDSHDEEWLNFTVDGYKDQEALRELEANQAEVLTGLDAFNFRIVCALDPEDEEEEGLWLHSLRHCDEPDDYLRGCWFY